MKLTVKEYCSVFGAKSKDDVQAKCRNGELDAEKNEKGIWVINVPIPKEVYIAKQQAVEKRAYADALLREYRKTEKEIQDLMEVVINFRNGVDSE